MARSHAHRHDHDHGHDHDHAAAPKRKAKPAPRDAADLGERKTGQREAILDVIRRSRGPLTVNEIHTRARRSIPTLGIATVYRAVKLLLEAEFIRAVVLPDGQTRYEEADLGHHHHFRCRVCDAVFDLDVCPLSLPPGTVFPGGFLVEDHELTLYGVCPGCRGGRGDRKTSKGR